MILIPACKGYVVDGEGVGVAGQTVQTNAGTSAVSASDGFFCLAAPATESVVVYVDGWQPVAVEPVLDDTCDLGCVEANIVLSDDTLIDKRMGGIDKLDAYPAQEVIITDDLDIGLDLSSA